MKKLLLISLTMLLSSGIAFSQNEETSMSGILKDGQASAAVIEEKGYEIVRMEFDIVQSEKETYRYMYEGYTYGIFGFGDYRIKDLDVEVYKDVDGNWTKISEDKDDASTALLSIKPSTTGLYKIVIKGYKYNEGYDRCHYGIIIFHE